MAERDGWKPHNEEAAFNSGSQGGNTSGRDPSSSDSNNIPDEKGDGASKKLRGKNKTDMADEPRSQQQDQPSTEDEGPILVYLPPVGGGSFIFGGFEIRHRSTEKRSSQSDATDSKHISYKRYRKGRHGGNDHSPGPNKPSRAK